MSIFSILVKIFLKTYMMNQIFNEGKKILEMIEMTVYNWKKDGIRCTSLYNVAGNEPCLDFMSIEIKGW